jgi:putative MATE family efflux protein
MFKNPFLSRYIGDKKFYRTVLAVSVPMIIQNGITNIVNLLDNVMVGQVSTAAMSGVSIVNQFIFVFNLLIFGAVSAAGIFTAQFHGFGDVEGERHTFRFKILINLLAGALGVIAFAAFDDQLIKLFLQMEAENSELSPAEALYFGKQYLWPMLIGLVPYAISQAYASTMRETGQTVVPMVASSSAVATNFVLNAILIFGLFGAPALGVMGAAIATVVARFVELIILIIWGHTHKEKCPYLVGAYRSLYIPRTLFGRIIVKGLPLMANEFFWAIAITIRNQSYSTCGLDVVAAQNIAITIINVFSVVYLSLGSAIAIVVGNQLGAGDLEKARDTDRKMIVFSVICAACVGLVLIGLAPVFPLLYKAPDSVRSLATFMIVISGCALPFFSYAHAAYFTLRSGGKVGITFLFDSVYMWSIVIPTVVLLANFTSISIYWLYIAGTVAEVLKCIFGFIFLRKINWARRLVSDGE